MLQYVFTENITYQEYKRFKYNLIDILTALGGLFNSIYLIGFAFTISFSYNLFLSSIIRKVYHFNARFESELKKKKKKNKSGASNNVFDDTNDRGNQSVMTNESSINNGLLDET